MKGNSRIGLYALGFLLVWAQIKIVPFWYRYFLLAGFRRAPVSQLDCSLHHLELSGCEDTLYYEGKIITACGKASDRWGDGWYPPLGHRNETVSNYDKFYQWDLASDTVMEIKTDLIGETTYHGFDILKTDQGALIYAINHLKTGSVIDIFDWPGKDKMHHVSRLASEKLNTPNAIYVADKDNLFVTNDHFNKNGTRRRIEDLTRRGWSFMTRYSHGRWSADFQGWKRINGITADDKHVYVAESGDGYVNVCNVSRSGQLDVVQKIDLGMYLDNLRISGDDLWFAAIPKPFQWRRYTQLRGKSKGPKSVIGRINRKELGRAIQPTVDLFEVPYVGVSTAVRVGNEIIISGLLSHGLVDDFRAKLRGH